MSHSEVSSKTSSYQEVCFLTNWQTRFARLQGGCTMCEPASHARHASHARQTREACRKCEARREALATRET